MSFVQTYFDKLKFVLVQSSLPLRKAEDLIDEWLLPLTIAASSRKYKNEPLVPRVTLYDSY